MKQKILATALTFLLVGATVPLPAHAKDELGEGNRIKHILLISVDGLHALGSRITSPLIRIRRSPSSAVTA